MSALSSFVWGIADVLRGPYKPNQYGNVILPFTILRRLECVMAPHREVMRTLAAQYADSPGLMAGALRKATRTPDSAGISFWNTSAYTLAKALQDPENLAANLTTYVHGFNADIDVFQSFKFDEVIAELDAHGRLGLVTKAFAEIDLSPTAVDNAGMGDLFENLIYKFAEASNEQAGDFYTPRDAIRLLVDLVLADDVQVLKGSGVVRSVYDPTAGTGGMLSVTEEVVKEINPLARLELFAQEINPSSYAICKSDLLIKGQAVGNVRRGDTLANDLHDRAFDYVLSNPPFGQDWKASEESVKREHGLGSRGRFEAGLPAIGDGAMLFLQHVVAKLRAVDEHGRGGRAGIVLNGSPLFNGGAGSGPSNIRGHLLENDLVEAIVGLPGDMFYNTGIATYLWILTNAKPAERHGKVQLIDASGFATKLRKSLGSKRVEVSDADRERVLTAFREHQESDISKVFENLDFAYWSVTVERPLRLSFSCAPERVDKVEEHKTLSKVKGLLEALRSASDELLETHQNRDLFMKLLGRHLGASGVGLTPAQRKALWQTLGERDETADIVTGTKGNPEPDTGLRDTEIVPFGWNGFAKSHDARDETVRAYFEAEVLPHVEDAWIDESKTRVGYEIPFTRHFYKYVPPRPLEEIDADLNKVVTEILAMLREVEQ